MILLIEMEGVDRGWPKVGGKTVKITTGGEEIRPKKKKNLVEKEK